jgi:shikimate dehydrogenase
MEFGLIGKKLSHSFSQRYFTQKFAEEQIDAVYHNFELPSIDHLHDMLRAHPDLRGFNVTIPYKIEIIPLLDSITESAQAIGAVNVVKVQDGLLHGHNTDVLGFRDSLAAFCKAGPGGKALVLGTGGASRAVVYSLRTYFEFDEIHLASRTPDTGQVSYEALGRQGLQDYSLIVNTTAVGQFPKAEERLPLPFDTLHPGQYLYDLIYNPAVTSFLAEGQRRGCHCLGGMEMLIGQAEQAWQIWNAPDDVV